MDQLTVRRAAMREVAETIRTEMVCCDIFARMMNVYHAQGISAYRELKRSNDYHAICYYGELAARYVDEEADEVGREQEEARSTSEGCRLGCHHPHLHESP